MREETIHDEFLRAVARCWLSFKGVARQYLKEQGWDLTFEQAMTLSMLQEEDGLNLKAIAEKTDRDRTTTTRMIDGLEKRDMVVRVPDQNDNRQKRIYLTRNGRKYMEDLDERSSGFVEMTMGQESEKDLKLAAKVLERVAARMGEK